MNIDQINRMLDTVVVPIMNGDPVDLRSAEVIVKAGRAWAFAVLAEVSYRRARNEVPYIAASHEVVDAKQPKTIKEK